MSNLTREEAAALKIQRELAKRTQGSIFNRDGSLNREAANGMSEGHTYLSEYLDMSRIPYPPDPDGSDHAAKLARIVEYMAQLPGSWGGVVGGPLDVHEQKVLHACALLYAVGKKDGVEGYAERSAAFADKFFRDGGGAGTYWSKESVREDTCRLIYNHVRPEEVRVDKRLQVFADALRYELCRLGVNTAEGMALLKQQWKPELFYSGWAADRANARAYMLMRSWK